MCVVCHLYQALQRSFLRALCSNRTGPYSRDAHRYYKHKRFYGDSKDTEMAPAVDKVVELLIDPQNTPSGS